MQIRVKTVNSDILAADGGVRATALQIFKTQIDSLDLPQVKELAQQLKRKNRYEDTQAVYAWVKSNIKYKRDPEGVEVIRRADATLSERVGDCEDMTILINALLYSMGYQMNEIKSNVIAQDKDYCHIFPTLGYDNRTDSGVITGVAMDCVPEISVHNEIASPITKAKVFTLQEMKNMADAGKEPIMGVKGNIAGLGGSMPTTDLTKELQRKQSEILQRAKGGILSAEDRKHLRKIHTIIRMNGVPEQKYMAQLLPFMEDVTPSGNIVWRDGSEEEVAIFLNAADLEMQTGENLTNDSDGIEGLGAILPKLKAKLKAAAQKKTLAKPKVKNQVPPKGTSVPRPVAPKKKVGTKLKDVLKKVVDKVKTEIKEGVQHPGHTLIRFQPGTIAIRNGALLGFDINIFHLASKLQVGYFTEKEAKDKGLDLDEWKKAVAATQKAEDSFFKIGGEREKFKKAVKKGYDLGVKHGKGIKGVEEIGVVEPVSATIVGMATAFFSMVGTFLKGVNFKKMQSKAKDKDVNAEQDLAESFADGDTRNFYEKATGAMNLVEDILPSSNGFSNEGEQEVAQQNFTNYTETPGNENASAPEGGTSDGKTPDGKDGQRLFGAGSWMPWVLGGGAIVAGLYFLNSK